MPRPKPKKTRKPLAPCENPASPDYISPAEERRLRRLLMRRVEQLSKVAEEKGYGPAFTFTKEEMRF